MNHNFIIQVGLFRLKIVKSNTSIISNYINKLGKSKTSLFGTVTTSSSSSNNPIVNIFKQIQSFINSFIKLISDFFVHKPKEYLSSSIKVLKSTVKVPIVNIPSSKSKSSSAYALDGKKYAEMKLKEIDEIIYGLQNLKQMLAN